MIHNTGNQNAQYWSTKGSKLSKSFPMISIWKSWNWDAPLATMEMQCSQEMPTFDKMKLYLDIWVCQDSEKRKNLFPYTQVKLRSKREKNTDLYNEKRISRDFEMALNISYINWVTV